MDAGYAVERDFLLGALVVVVAVPSHCIGSGGSCFKTLAFGDLTDGLRPVDVVSVAGSIVEDMAVALVHLPVGAQTLALWVNRAYCVGDVGCRACEVPYADFCDTAAEPLLSGIVCP